MLHCNICLACGKIGSLPYKRMVCDDCLLKYKRHRREASLATKRAIRDGILYRPLECELCGNTHISLKQVLYGHHWNGYDRPLDVWFICSSCNQKLLGPPFHCGFVTKAQARKAIRSKQYRKQLLQNYIKEIRI